LAVVKFIAGGGKITKIAPIYQTDRELTRYSGHAMETLISPAKAAKNIVRQ